MSLTGVGSLKPSFSEMSMISSHSNQSSADAGQLGQLADNSMEDQINVCIYKSADSWKHLWVDN